MNNSSKKVNTKRQSTNFKASKSSNLLIMGVGSVIGIILLCIIIVIFSTKSSNSNNKNLHTTTQSTPEGELQKNLATTDLNQAQPHLLNSVQQKANHSDSAIDNISKLQPNPTVLTKHQTVVKEPELIPEDSERTKEESEKPVEQLAEQLVKEEHTSKLEQAVEGEILVPDQQEKAPVDIRMLSTGNYTGMGKMALKTEREAVIRKLQAKTKELETLLVLVNDQSSFQTEVAKFKASCEKTAAEYELRVTEAKAIYDLGKEEINKKLAELGYKEASEQTKFKLLYFNLTLDQAVFKTKQFLKSVKSDVFMFSIQVENLIRLLYSKECHQSSSVQLVKLFSFVPVPVPLLEQQFVKDMYKRLSETDQAIKNDLTASLMVINEYAIEVMVEGIEHSRLAARNRAYKELKTIMGETIECFTKPYLARNSDGTYKNLTSLDVIDIVCKITKDEGERLWGLQNKCRATLFDFQRMAWDVYKGSPYKVKDVWQVMNLGGCFNEKQTALIWGLGNEHLKTVPELRRIFVMPETTNENLIKEVIKKLALLINKSLNVLLI